ncbi:major Facilitator Superfamily protein [bacterium BMS3Bbin10]|nr:major Facilitator Superfamily protein [bacterium BMS3Bbin10]
MTPSRLHFMFLNIGHFLDHFFMLIFATVAALTLWREWGMSYGELIPYATPGFIAFGLFALPAGWLADKWSRRGMMAAFFIGVGVCSMLTSLAQTPLQMGAALFAMGVFAAIYHPVGIPLVIEGRVRTGMPIAINGVFGNLGVASAALITGFMIDNAGWRAAFIWPGIVCVGVGLAYLWFFAKTPQPAKAAKPAEKEPAKKGPEKKKSRGRSYQGVSLIRIFAIILVTTALGGMVFQSTTFALPKIFDERLGGMALSATLVGWYAFLVFALAAFAQLVVGYLLDRHSARLVFIGVAALQAVFFALMPGLHDWAALAVAFAFMLAVFGQIPINDVLLGRLTTSEWRSRAFACRYIVTFSALAASIPMIAWVHANWGFDRLFMGLAVAALLILLAVIMLPRAMPAQTQSAIAE